VPEDHRNSPSVGARPRELVGGTRRWRTSTAPRGHGAVEIHGFDDERLARAIATAARVFMGVSKLGAGAKTSASTRSRHIGELATTGASPHPTGINGTTQGIEP
jgi:hypothetical protein